MFKKEKIIEYKTCEWTWEDFPIYEKDLEMLDKLSPVIWWKKFYLLTPNLSPKAREINRLMFRNERKFYNIELENWKKEITTIHPLMRKNIVNIEEFNNYDFTTQWLDYSWEFFKDFKELLFSSPNASRLVAWMENSPYCNQEADDKNCHLNAGWHENEDSLYNTFAVKSKDVIDNYWVFKSENVYDSINIFDSSKVFFSNQIKNSFQVYFWYDLIWCQNVIFWNNLENKNYIYKNKQYSKEEWLNIKNDFLDKLKDYKKIEELKKEYNEFLEKTWKKEKFIIWSENVSWNIIRNSKNSFSSLYSEENENVRYINIAWNTKNSMDINSFAIWDKLYNVASWYNVFNSFFCASNLCCQNWFYNFSVDSIKFAFWCFWFWLKNKSYLILNKKYTKEEWEKTVVKIIEELKEKWIWWDFLNPELSPYPYNDSVAYEYYPIKKSIYLKDNKKINEKIENENWIWKVYILESDKFISKAIIHFWWERKINTFWRTKETEINISELVEKITFDKIPEIENIDESIINKVIICKKTKRPFRITKKELEFYKKYLIPIPRLHYDERHQNIINKKGIIK